MTQQDPNAWNQQGGPQPQPWGTTPNSQGGWASPPAGAPGAPAGQFGGADARVTKLNSDSQTWMIVALVGFFFGFGWITGPLTWYMGSKLRKDYAALGLPASSNAEIAYWAGIVVTGLMVFGVVIAIVAVLFLFGLGATAIGAAALAG